MLSAAMLSMSYLESNLTNALENPWYLTESSKRSFKSFGYSKYLTMKNLHMLKLITRRKHATAACINRGLLLVPKKRHIAPAKTRERLHETNSTDF